MPQVNFLLMAGVLYITFTFGSSSALGAAYGVSVIGAMITSSLLAILAIWKVLRRPLWLAVADHHAVPRDRVRLPRLEPAENFQRRSRAAADRRRLHSHHVDVGARLFAAAGTARGAMSALSNCWICSQSLRRNACAARPFSSPPIPHAAPASLMHNLKHNQVLHDQIILLTVRTARFAARRARRTGDHRDRAP